MGPFKDGWTKEQVESVIEENNPDDLLYVPIVITMDPPDYEWSESICLKLSEHPHFNVRGNAILGFAHLARIFGKASESSILIVKKALSDNDEYVRGQAVDARDDIEHYANIKLTDYSI